MVWLEDHGAWCEVHKLEDAGYIDEVAIGRGKGREKRVIERKLTSS